MSDKEYAVTIRRETGNTKEEFFVYVQAVNEGEAIQTLWDRMGPNLHEGLYFRVEPWGTHAPSEYLKAQVGVTTLIPRLLETPPMDIPKPKPWGEGPLPPRAVEIIDDITFYKKSICSALGVAEEMLATSSVQRLCLQVGVDFEKVARYVYMVDRLEKALEVLRSSDS